MLHLPSCVLTARGSPSFLPPYGCLARGGLLRHSSCAFLQEREKVAGRSCDAAQREGGHDFQEQAHLRSTRHGTWEAAGLKAGSTASSPLLLPAHPGTWSREAKDHLGAIINASERSSQPMLRPRIDFLSRAGAHALQKCVRVEWGELGPGW